MRLRPFLYLSPLALVACSDLPDLPAPARDPVHQLMMADTHAIAVDDSFVDPDTGVGIDAGTIVITGSPVSRPTTTDSNGNQVQPTELPELPIATAATIGRDHACVLARGDVYCWGDHTKGALGAHRACATPDASGCALDPAIMPTLPKIAALAAGDDVTCAIAQDDARVYCWGDTADGRLGGSFVPALTTPEPVHLPNPVATLRLQGGTACAIDDHQLAWCWGIGFGATPKQLDLVGVIDVAIGARHSCAISSLGLQCWGDDRNGESGDYEVAKKCGYTSPTCTVGPTTISIDATRVVVGERHSCALDRAGNAWCWGSNERGQAGQSDAWLVGKPEIVVRQGIDLAASYAKTCVVDVDHLAWCFGDFQRTKASDP